MTVTVAKSTLIENIYKNFFDILNGNASFTSSIYPAFPDIKFDDKSDYPVFILGSPDVGQEQFTLGKTVVDGTIEFEVYTADAKTCDEFTSDAINHIETSKGTLADVGLHEVMQISTSKEVIPQGDVRVHIKTITFSYKFYYTKTTSY